MTHTLRIHTTVLSGQRIEISSPELSEGQAVEVIVVPVHAKAPLRLSMLEYVKSLPIGPLLYRSAQEADQCLQEERDSWGR